MDVEGLRQHRPAACQTRAQTGRTSIRATGSIRHARPSVAVIRIRQPMRPVANAGRATGDHSSTHRTGTSHLRALYEAQPWVAGLAPIMMHNRLDLMLPTLADLEECDPGDDHPWRAFSQAMLWSTDMTANRRRRADVIQKQGKSFASLDALNHEDLDLTETETNDDYDD